MKITKILLFVSLFLLIPCLKNIKPRYVCLDDTAAHTSLPTVTTTPFPSPTNSPTPTHAKEASKTKLHVDYRAKPEKVKIESISEAEILTKIDILREVFPDGTYWNHGGVSNSPCSHKDGEKYCNGYNNSFSRKLWPEISCAGQCLGFVIMLQDYLFGADTPMVVIDSYDDVRIGDHIRIDNIHGGQHSILVIEKNDEYVVAAECNEDFKTCKIEWGRKYYRKDLDNWDTWYISKECEITKNNTCHD